MTLLTHLNASVGQNGRNLPDDVRAVQSLLRDRGCDPGPCDGVCGPRTVAAVRSFQRRFMTAPDGLVVPGRTTWQRLSSNAPEPVPHAAQDWSGDSARWPEQKKLQSMNPALATKVRAVLEALRRRGYQPKVFYGWRSVAVQAELFALGRSKVRFGFHNAQRPDGTPNAYAADIIDARYAWTPEAETSGFWAALGEEARRQGLVWGGDWSGFRDWAHVQLLQNAELGRVKVESGL